MTTNDPSATVQRMFESFATGDLNRLLETVHPDSRWTYVGANPLPRKSTFMGRERIRRFFEGIFRNVDMTAFEIRELVIDNDTVVVFGYEEGTSKRTGEPFRNEWSQKYIVKDNQITEMEEYNIRVSPIT